MIIPKKIKYISYSIIPALVLFTLIEIIARLFSIANPAFITAPLPDEFRGLTESHDQLFWALIPNTNKKEPDGTTIIINSNGFRGPELTSKRNNEFRILSLGESTTFGAGVENNETYSALLGNYLDSLTGGKYHFKVLNCGFSAYSSFQSLKYFELYGLDYKPDMLIIYNEVNDYLPSTLRNYGHHETSAYLTDKQLYESKFNSMAAKIIKRSEFLKFLNYRYAEFKIRSLSKEERIDPLLNIGMRTPSKIPNRLYDIKDEENVPAGLNETSLGQRVSEEERLEIFEAFRKMCKENNIELIVIHPSYKHSIEHECLLTDFCKERDVLMFEADHTLHPNNVGNLFLDDWHPTKEGHARLAEELGKFIVKKVEF